MRITRLALSAVSLGFLSLSFATAMSPVAAAECLAAPNKPAPDGQHWFFKTERPANKKCWYLRAGDGETTGAVASERNAAPAPPPSVLPFAPARAAPPLGEVEQERLFQDFVKWRSQRRETQ